MGALRLKECYDKLISENLEECAKDIIRLIVRIGGVAAGNKNILTRVEFLDGSIEQYAIDIIQGSPFLAEISGEIKELYIKGNGDRNEIWEFIKNLGNRMQTNFGFMFDWRTGQKYSDNDPRRK